jgi:hypothetical protein
MDGLHGLHAHFYRWRHAKSMLQSSRLLSTESHCEHNAADCEKMRNMLGIFQYIQESVWWRCFLEPMWSNVLWFVIKNHLTKYFTMISDAYAVFQNNSSKRCFWTHVHVQGSHPFDIRDPIPSFATHFRHTMYRKSMSQFQVKDIKIMHIQGLHCLAWDQHTISQANPN